MDVDRPRQRDTVDRELLIVHPIGGKTGEQNSDQRNQGNDEAQSNHSLTRQSGGGERGTEMEGICGFCGGGDKSTLLTNANRRRNME